MLKVKSFIDNHADVLTKADKIGLEDVALAEKALGFGFDAEYKSYLSNFGKISYNSMELYGLGVPETSYLNVVAATKELQNELGKMPDNSVVLEDIGESNYVVYQMNGGVLQVNSSDSQMISSSLEEYIMTRLLEA